MPGSRITSRSRRRRPRTIPRPASISCATSTACTIWATQSARPRPTPASRLKPDGSWMLVEPFRERRRGRQPQSDRPHLLFGASTIICTPASLSQDVGTSARGPGGQGAAHRGTQAGRIHARAPRHRNAVQPHPGSKTVARRASRRFAAIGDGLPEPSGNRFARAHRLLESATVDGTTTSTTPSPNTANRRPPAERITVLRSFPYREIGQSRTSPTRLAQYCPDAGGTPTCTVTLSGTRAKGGGAPTLDADSDVVEGLAATSSDGAREHTPGRGAARVAVADRRAPPSASDGALSAISTTARSSG